MTPWRPKCASITVDEFGALLAKRITELTDWLKHNAPECCIEQKHLDADTPEQVYWHYGYLCALRDSLVLLKQSSHTVDTSSQN